MQIRNDGLHEISNYIGVRLVNFSYCNIYECSWTSSDEIKYGIHMYLKSDVLEELTMIVTTI